MYIHEARVEHRVLNEELIREGIRTEDGASIDDERRRSMLFADIQSVSLSFKNLVSIAHLNALTGLKKLQIDNNRIEMISNLDALIHLQWLDLSFNRITRIDGLEKLTNLTDLSLFQNRISVVENLDKLSQLQFLSLGNNLISKLEAIDNLRRFKDLRTLTLSGNPVCQMGDYHSYVLSRLPNLESLNYKRIRQEDVFNAQERHQDDVLEIMEREEDAAERQRLEDAEQEHATLMKTANLTGIDDLFERMESNDPEWERLGSLPGIEEIWNETKTKLSSASEEFKNTMFRHLKLKENETRQWSIAIDANVGLRQELSRQAILEFEREKKRIIQGSNSENETSVSRLKVLLMNLKASLFEIEEEIVEIVTQLNRTYEAAATELNVKATALSAAYFTQIRDLLNGYSTLLSSTALSVFERFYIDNYSDKIPEPVRVVLADKDTLIAAIQCSQDFKIHLVDTLEEELHLNGLTSLEKLCNDIHHDAHCRHGDRMTEILNYMTLNVDDIDAFTGRWSKI